MLIDRLFVYGTLRPGSGNEQALWLQEKARHLGVGRLRGRLYLLSRYPALGPPLSKDDWVTGDLFEGMTNEMFSRLDDYEGAEYARELTEITTGEGQVVAAYLYRYLMPLDELRWIPSGDWKMVNP